jgi:hypothetical protein
MSAHAAPRLRAALPQYPTFFFPTSTSLLTPPPKNLPLHQNRDQCARPKTARAAVRYPAPRRRTVPTAHGTDRLTHRTTGLDTSSAGARRGRDTRPRFQGVAAGTSPSEAKAKRGGQGGGARWWWWRWRGGDRHGDDEAQGDEHPAGVGEKSSRQPYWGPG